MPRLELFRQNAREFSNLTDTEVNGWFDTSAAYLDQYTISEGKLELAFALFAAHLCWLSKYPGQGGASRGPIVSESDDRMGAKKQYAKIEDSDTWLGQSHYGQSFTNLTGIRALSKHKASILTAYGTNPSFLPCL